MAAIVLEQHTKRNQQQSMTNTCQQQPPWSYPTDTGQGVWSSKRQHQNQDAADQAGWTLGRESSLLPKFSCRRSLIHPHSFPSIGGALQASTPLTPTACLGQIININRRTDNNKQQQ